MTLTDEDRAAIAEICKTHRYANTGERYQWSSAMYLAGLAAGMERAAVIFDKAATATRGTHSATIALQIAACIRAATKDGT
jgi:hypothetical protein